MIYSTYCNYFPFILRDKLIIVSKVMIGKTSNDIHLYSLMYN